MTKTTAVLAVALLATSSAVIAADKDKDSAAHAPAAWASMDINSDGVLTRDEVASTPWAQKFDQMDANHDGKVTKKEFKQYERRMKRRQNKQDTGSS